MIELTLSGSKILAISLFNPPLKILFPRKCSNYTQCAWFYVTSMPTLASSPHPLPKEPVRVFALSSLRIYNLYSVFQAPLVVRIT